MIGYKAFDEDLKCRNFQYEVGNIYEFDGEPVPCKQGFHFCKSIAETYKYYNMSKSTRVCKVEAIGEISTDDEIKYCTNKIKICEEITEDWKRKGNANSSSNGYCNTGSCNTGHQNTGNCNTGSYNTGNYNTGHQNTGNCNTGSYNTGGYNTGYRNTGNCNTGSYNTGHRNTGNCNTGDCNTGNRNTGDYNSTDYSSGCFNSKEQYIWMFDKPTELTLDEWRHSDAYYILKCIPREVVEWVSEKYMSDEEKLTYPSYKTTNGYLKVLDEKESAQYYWDGLSEYEKKKIYDLPNFDKDIFKQCTGINISC